MSVVETIRGRETRITQLNGDAASILARAEQLAPLVATFDSVAAMAASDILSAGMTATTSGYYALGDGGGALYEIMTSVAFGGVPDGYGDHTLPNGLVAKLVHSSVIDAEWFGCIGNIDVSARMQAAWYRLVAWQDANNANGDQPILLRFHSACNISNQVMFQKTAGGRVPKAFIDFTSSKLTAVSGGNLSSTNAMFLCRFLGGVQHWGELNGGKFAACYDFNGPGTSRTFNPVARNQKGKGIRVRGEAGSFVMHNPIVTEYVQSDTEFNTQANFTAIGLSAETNDFQVWGGNINFNKTGVYLDASLAVQVHFNNLHITGGNPNADGGAILPFTNMVLVENRAVTENHFDNCYFDNGIIEDFECSLNISGGHYVKNSASTITEPKIRLYPKTAAQTTMPNINIRGLGGLATVGLVDNGANTWAGSLANMSSFYAGMDDENTDVSVLKTNYYLYPANSPDTQIHIKAQGKFIETYSSGASSFQVFHDPAGAVTEFQSSVVRNSTSGADRAFFVGTGDNGISETNGAGGVLNLHSGGAKQWQSLVLGHFVPLIDGTQNIGSSALSILKVFTRSIGIGQNNVTISTGTGTPEGSLAAPVGSVYLREDGGAGTTLYVKQSGTGNTGWVGK